MDDARDAWGAVGAKVESLGLKLKLHMEQEADEAVPDRAAGDTRTALDQLSTRVTDAFDAFGNAARDEAVHSDVREIADLIRAALIETFEAVGAEVGDMIEQLEDAAEKLAGTIGVDLDPDGGDPGAGGIDAPAPDAGVDPAAVDAADDATA